MAGKQTIGPLACLHITGIAVLVPLDVRRCNPGVWIPTLISRTVWGSSRAPSARGYVSLSMAFVLLVVTVGVVVRALFAGVRSRERGEELDRRERVE